jgi:ADP-dependent NAD(P)H-hydrate dehydratase / NAD(P)H-hydrate epimerase
MPIPVITIAQMRDWEKATWASGQTEAEVIRRVGKCVAGHALRLTRPDDQIVILAGKGHNGEDARCSPDHLTQRRVNLIDVKDPAADFSKLDAVLSLNPDLVIDGLFGIGINRPLSAEWIRFIERVNASRAKILAVDVPSGLNGETGEPQGAAIRASVTLTVGAPKVGMLQESAWPYVGRLEVATEVGLITCSLKSELNWTLAKDFCGFPPARSVATHKGTYGHVGIIAGSVGYHGASVLAGRGAQRAQPGLITLHTQEGTYHPVASQLQAVMVSPWKRDPDLSHYSAILIGPGLAAADLPDEIKKLTGDLWLNSPVPIVVDASALAWLPAGRVPPKALRLITPHPGEAARLLDITSKEVQADRLKSLRRLSERYGDTWVVLKGHQTLIGRNFGDVFVNSSGNPHLAQGGSGDLLSGYLVGLLAQPHLQEVPQKTICCAVWQHGGAADRFQNSRPNWVVEDLVEELGREAQI